MYTYIRYGRTAEQWLRGIPYMYRYIYMYMYIHIYVYNMYIYRYKIVAFCHGCYGVATISRLLKITSLFCKRALLKRLYSAKEPYDFKEPTNRSNPIRDRGCRASESRLLKLQVSFAEYRLFYRALLEKRPIILRNLLIIATPYVIADVGRQNMCDICRVSESRTCCMQDVRKSYISYVGCQKVAHVVFRVSESHTHHMQGVRE